MGSPKIKTLLKKWRERRGVSQAGAATLLEVPYSTYVKWEQGDRTPRGMALRALILIVSNDPQVK
jgi:DNA-binding transcriptional regulator YiaG